MCGTRGGGVGVVVEGGGGWGWLIPMPQYLTDFFNLIVRLSYHFVTLCWFQRTFNWLIAGVVIWRHRTRSILVLLMACLKLLCELVSCGIQYVYMYNIYLYISLDNIFLKNRCLKIYLHLPGASMIGEYTFQITRKCHVYHNTWRI